MTQHQLDQILEFVTPFYTKTGKYHNWDHIQSVRKNAKLLQKGIALDPLLLDAACLIHDIGRSVVDEGHPQESAKIATPFLESIQIPTKEIGIICDAVSHHALEDISQATSQEAKVLFDADKLEILSVYGFLRTICWLMEERALPLEKALDFLWKYVQEVQSGYLQTEQAKKIVSSQTKTLSKMVKSFKSWNIRNQ